MQHHRFRRQTYQRSLSGGLPTYRRSGDLPRGGRRRQGDKGLHPRIDQLQQAYCKEDPPLERVKPVPVQLLRHAAASRTGDAFLQAVLDLLIIGFFFLLQPGEHVYSKEIIILSASWTCPSSPLRAPSMPLLSPPLNSPTVPQSTLSSPTKRMERKGKPLHMATMTNPLSLLSRLLHGGCNTYENTMPPVRHRYIWRTSRTARPSKSAALTLPNAFDLATSTLASSWALTALRSALEPYAPAAPWRSYAQKSTTPPSV